MIWPLSFIPPVQINDFQRERSRNQREKREKRGRQTERGWIHFLLLGWPWVTGKQRR